MVLPPLPRSQRACRRRQEAYLLATFKWVSGGKELHISGLVWNIDALGRKVGIPPALIRSKCWPFLLTRRGEVKRPGLCANFGQEPGHKHAKDSAHTVPRPLDLLNLSTDRRLCRYPTDAEAAALAASIEAAGLHYSAFRERAAHGRGDGRSPHSGAVKGAAPPGFRQEKRHGI